MRASAKLLVSAVRGTIHPRDAAAELLGTRSRRARVRPRFDSASSQLILSPHFDDAVLSCWTTLVAPGDVIVANIFTGRPSHDVLAHYDRLAGAASSAELMARREAEDRTALARAGRRPTNLGFLESQYRSRAPAVDHMLHRLGAQMPAVRSVLAPAAIGLHPDHVLARQAGLALADAGYPVTFYADVPYCATYGWPAWVTGRPADRHLDVDVQWAPAVAALASAGVEPVATVSRLDEGEQAAKLAALRTYETQYPMLTRGPLDVLADPAVLGFEVRWSTGSMAR